MAQVNLVSGNFTQIITQDPVPVVVTTVGSLSSLLATSADEAAYISGIWVSNLDAAAFHVGLFIYNGSTNKAFKDYVLVQKRATNGCHFNLLEGVPLYLPESRTLKVQITAQTTAAPVAGVSFIPSWTKMIT